MFCAASRRSGLHANREPDRIVGGGRLGSPGNGGSIRSRGVSGGQVQENVELLPEVGGPGRRLAEAPCLASSSAVRASTVPSRASFSRPAITLKGTGADFLGGQQSPVKLIHAAEQFAPPLVELGLAELLVRLGEPDLFLNLEEVPLLAGAQYDAGERRRSDSRRLPPLSAGGIPRRSARVVRTVPNGSESGEHGIADNLGEEVGPGRARRVPFALDVEGGEFHKLVVGDDSPPGLVKRQFQGRRRRRGDSWGRRNQGGLHLCPSANRQKVPRRL